MFNPGNSVLNDFGMIIGFFIYPINLVEERVDVSIAALPQGEYQAHGEQGVRGHECRDDG